MTRESEMEVAFMQDPTGDGFRLPDDAEVEIAHIILGEWSDFAGSHDIQTVLEAWASYIRSCLARIREASRYTQRLLDLQKSLHQAREDALDEAWRSYASLKRVAPALAAQLAEEIREIGPAPDGPTAPPVILPAITEVPLLEAIQIALVAGEMPAAPSDILKRLKAAGRKDTDADLRRELSVGKREGVLDVEAKAGRIGKWFVVPRD